MQQALRTNVPRPELNDGPAHCAPRRNKLLVASVAMLGAGAIAVTPVAAQAPDVQQRTVALAASVTDNPATVYQELLTESFANLTNLGQMLTANPSPFLRQLAENQAGYAEQFAAGFAALPASVQSFWNGNNGLIRLQNAQAALQAGQIAEAYDQLNRFNLYSLAVFSPVYNLLLSAPPSPRLPEGRVGIPERIAQNLANVVATVFSSSSVVGGTSKSLLGPFIGMNFELALAAEAIVQAVAAGDVQGAVNALINTPARALHGLLNGYVDPTCTEDCEEFPGLINATGPIGDIFVRIPTALANVIKPAEPEVDDPAEAPATANAQLVTLSVVPEESTSATSDDTVTSDVTRQAAEAPVTETEQTVAADEDSEGTTAADEDTEGTAVADEDSEGTTAADEDSSANAAEDSTAADEDSSANAAEDGSGNTTEDRTAAEKPSSVEKDETPRNARNVVRESAVAGVTDAQDRVKKPATGGLDASDKESSTSASDPKSNGAKKSDSGSDSGSE